jgi:hypothetical protein
MGYAPRAWATFAAALTAVAGAAVVLAAPNPRQRSVGNCWLSPSCPVQFCSSWTGARVMPGDRRIARYVERFSPNTITAILVAVAEVTVIARAGGGFYWLIPAVAANLIGGGVNAWQFLVRLPS